MRRLLPGLIIQLGVLVACVHEEAVVDKPKTQAPHVEVLVDGHRSIIARLGQRVYAKAKAFGGTWKCTTQLWCADGHCTSEGVLPGVQCADEVGSWIWPDGQGKEFRFIDEGSHQICIEVYDSKGHLIGDKKDCALVEVPHRQL